MPLSRRVRIAAILVGALLASIALFLATRPREPSYHGKTLSAWLKDFDTFDEKKRAEAEAAIRAMGPKAVPFLGQSVAQRDSITLRIYRSDYFPRKWATQIRSKIPWRPPLMESRSAALALSVL